MLNKTLKTALQFFLGGVIMMFIAIGCNDTASTTETKTDSTAVDTASDTTKMDTAKTKPVVIPDEPSK